MNTRIRWIGLMVILLGLSATPREATEVQTQAMKIINQHLAAIGGSKALADIRDYSISGTAKVSVMGQGQTGQLTFVMKAPARWRESFSSGQFQSASGSDGSRIWAVGNGQVRPVGELQQQIELEWAGMKILTGPPRPGWTMKVEGQQMVHGKKAVAIELTAPSGRKGRYFLDAKTHLLLRSVVPAYNPMSRQETEATTDFEQYKKVGPFMLPHWIFNSNGFLSKEIEVSEWKFNTEPSDSLFQLPSR